MTVASFYTVVVAETINELAERVNDLMVQGWTPQGGLCTIEYLDSDSVRMNEYYQAMVRPRPEERQKPD